MELFVVRHDFWSIRPATDEDAEAIAKMKYGVPYRCDLRMPRNYQFLKKFWALVNASFSLLPSNIRDILKSEENFKQELLIFAGVTEKRWSLARNEMYEVAKSISFASMDEAEFSATYDLCVNCVFMLFERLGVSITEEQFNKYLANF